MLRLLNRRMYRRQPREELLERRREAVVRLDLREEQRVAAPRRWLVQYEEERRAWGLFFVGLFRV